MTSKIINDMAKVQIKSEKITPFGGIFHVRELFPDLRGLLSSKFWVFVVRHTAISTTRLWVHCKASISVGATVWRTWRAIWYPIFRFIPLFAHAALTLSWVHTGARLYRSCYQRDARRYSSTARRGTNGRRPERGKSKSTNPTVH